MKAVVLAAGVGKRMGPITQQIPKPMINVAGRPVLEHIVTRIARIGIDEFVIVTRHLGHVIEQHFGDGGRLGVRIAYVAQSDRYGTGAALYEAKDLVAGGPLMMVYGDIITPAANYAGALAVFGQNAPSAVMTLNWVEDPWAGGAVHVDERTGLVCAVVEKPPKGEVPSHWNSAGIFVFAPVIFEYLSRLEPSPRGEYELPDALNAMIRDGLEIRPYYLQGDWCDVGRPEDIPIAELILNREEQSP